MATQMNQGMAAEAVGGVEEHSLEDLNAFYLEGESVDQEVFAEQRSNILLVAGEHYNRRKFNFLRRVRDSKDLTQEQKIRLTKNHIQRICKTYVNNIISMAPDVGFMPKNESELQDQKAAELHHAVWLDAKERYGIDELKDDWCDSFIQIGEVATKIFYDPMAGQLKGYEAQVGEDGQMVCDDMGQPIGDPSRPVHEGQFVFEEVYGFNLIRPAVAKDLRQAEWLAIRKMVSQKAMLSKFGDSEDMKKIFQLSQDQTYLVFDATRGGYLKDSGQCLIIEYFFRPCAQYPNGYFYFTTKHGVFAKGELPGGIFPVVFQAADKYATSPRGRSIVKTMRPYQVEINRAASKMAEHQITLGDDKIILQNGSKMSPGAALPGVRSINVTGQAPQILEGRSGAQYLEYCNAQISELYDVMMVQEDSQEIAGQIDPYVLLFRSAKQKKRYQRYVKRFETYLINVVKTYLRLAKIHLQDDAVIYAVGRSEMVNIPEFRKMTDICYDIRVEAQSDDIETKLGKQMVLNHTLQYVGGQLNPEDIGKFMREMPFANFNESFDDMTIDYDSAENDILALDRGEKPPVGEFDNHPYMIKRLTARMRKADYKFLSPEVQQNYHMKLDMHQQMEAFKQLQIQRAKDGYIPTGGYLVVCDLYAPDPNDPSKTKRARVPYESLMWLLKQLETQGAALDEVQGMNEGSQAEIAQKMLAQGQGPNQMAGSPNGMGAAGHVRGAEMPQGAIPNDNGNYGDAIKRLINAGAAAG